MSNQSWHALEVKEVLHRLGTNEKRGLTKDEASSRLGEFGPNVLREEKRLRLLQLVVNQFKDAFVIMLLFACAASYSARAILGETKWRYVTVVTNGTLPLVDFGVGYFISIDGTEEVHNLIRGMKIYRKIKHNVIDHPEENVAINMTINRLNYECIEDVVREWCNLGRAFTFQFHTPFSYDDELWLPYGSLRNSTVDKLLRVKENYPDFIANTSKQLDLFRDGKWTVSCPSWFFVNLDSSGRKKQSCVISSADANGVKPICKRCGISCNAGAYSGLFLSDTEWFRMFKVAKRSKTSQE